MMALEEPLCPRCGSEMEERVARRGLSPGEKFWGCSDFPDCRGTRDHDEWIETGLDECLALSLHWEDERTPVGELVLRAKTYTNRPGVRRFADELAEIMIEGVRKHPGLAAATRFVGVPANPPKQPYNLPQLLAESVAAQLGVVYDESLVIKKRPTAQVKNLQNQEDKVAALLDAYEIARRVDGESIVIVDDLMRSGTTLSVISGLLRKSGARRVVGLVATKTKRG